jgi:hypothetical protein
MSELMSASQLRETAAPELQIDPSKQVLVMQWTVDEATGQAVSRWVAIEQDAPCFFSAVASAL